MRNESKMWAVIFTLILTCAAGWLYWMGEEVAARQAEYNSVRESGRSYGKYRLVATSPTGSSMLHGKKIRNASIDELKVLYNAEEGVAPHWMRMRLTLKVDGAEDCDRLTASFSDHIGWEERKTHVVIPAEVFDHGFGESYTDARPFCTILIKNPFAEMASFF